jgi:hypothetical protein
MSSRNFDPKWEAAYRDVQKLTRRGRSAFYWEPIAACSGVRSGSEVNPKRRLSRQRASQLSALLGQHLADSLHLRADSAQLFFDALVAAVDVVDAVDNRLAVRN